MSHLSSTVQLSSWHRVPKLYLIDSTRASAICNRETITADFKCNKSCIRSWPNCPTTNPAPPVDVVCRLVGERLGLTHASVATYMRAHVRAVMRTRVSNETSYNLSAALLITIRSNTCCMVLHEICTPVFMYIVHTCNHHKANAHNV